MPKSAKTCSCPDIKDEEWDLIEHDWVETTFYSVQIPMFLHKPIGLNRKIARAKKAIREKKYQASTPSIVMLKDGLFIGHVMIGVERPPVSASGIVTIPAGTMISKVYTGAQGGLNKEVAELLSYFRSKTGAHPDNVYFWYASCQDCESIGEKKIVLLARL